MQTNANCDIAIGNQVNPDLTGPPMPWHTGIRNDVSSPRQGGARRVAGSHGTVRCMLFIPRPFQKGRLPPRSLVAHKQ